MTPPAPWPPSDSAQHDQNGHHATMPGPWVSPQVGLFAALMPVSSCAVMCTVSHHDLTGIHDGGFMTEVPRPAWLAELIEVARQLYEASGGDKGALPAERPERIGKASPDAEAGPGWFWLDLGGQVVESDQLETAVLGPAEGPQQRRFQV